MIGQVRQNTYRVSSTRTTTFDLWRQQRRLLLGNLWVISGVLPIPHDQQPELF